MRISDWSSDVCSSSAAAGVPAWRQAWSEASFWDPRGSARLYHQAGVGLRCEGGVDGFDTLLGYRTATRFRPTVADRTGGSVNIRSEEHTSELQSLMRISYAVFCWQKKSNKH